MIVAVLAAVALAIAQCAAPLAPAREDTVAAAVRAIARVDVDVAAHLAALVPRERPPARRGASGRLWQGDLEMFERFCRTLTLDNGRRMRLEPFQRAMLRDFFDGATETYILIPKKNGKTTLLAALLVFHLCYVDNANAIVVASSVKQAGILYRHASGFVKRSAALQARILVRAGTKELRSRRDDGVAKVLAADVDTADGEDPTLAIIDELHRAKSLGLLGVLSDGLDARDGSLVAITTAGDDEDGPLGTIRGRFRALPGVKRAGKYGRYLYARSKDGSEVMHEWALEPGDDVEDLDLVKSVNPLRSMTKAKLRRRRNSKGMTATRWRRFACNLWVQGEDAAIADTDWLAARRAGARLPDGLGADVVIGVDLGWTRDWTGLVPVGFAGDERDEAIIDERLVGIPSPGDGSATDELVIKGHLRRLGHWETGLWPECRFAIDPNAGGQHVAQWIKQELCNGDGEARVITVSQQPAPMQTASMHFAEGLRLARVAGEAGGELVLEAGEDELRAVPLYHPDHPDLNRHARAAAAGWHGERWRFIQRKVPRSDASRVQPKPIDLVVAGTLAYAVLCGPRTATPEPFVIVC
jgi:hypothetical protein